MIFIGYAEANNTLIKPYNPCNQRDWIIGIDTDHSYGYSMTQHLPFQTLDLINP